ncbi:MAG: DUF4097 family beta strand repeat-containing protein [Xanthomonadales bacterium]|nr:DUF4097 family beta strand repeat-containing protein [Xanthomonadales bacterium]
MTGLLSALVLTAAVQAGEPIDVTRAANADTLVVVKNVKGEIRVSGWDRDEAVLSGELGAGSRDLVVEERGNQLVIEVEIPRNSRGVEETILDLQMPRKASLEVGSISARVDVIGLAGERLKVSSVSGDVDVEADTQLLELGTVSGDIDFTGSAQRTKFSSVSGDIDTSGLTGEVEVTTVSGEVYLKSGVLSDARFESVSGDLELYVDLSETASMTIESLSGDVDLHLPESLSARCEAESFSGSIKSNRGEVRSAKHGPHKSLEFVAGAGEARIRIESFSGDLRIRSD